MSTNMVEERTKITGSTDRWIESRSEHREVRAGEKRKREEVNRKSPEFFFFRHQWEYDKILKWSFTSLCATIPGGIVKA